MIVPVRLTWSELMQAAQVGVMRQVQNLREGRVDRYGASDLNGWTPHIEGAIGEMAVAKWMGLYWSGALGDLDADDVGQLQVRASAGQSARLILHPSDPDDRAFVLVTGRGPAVQINGWIVAEDGKQQQWWTDPAGGRPAFFVPQAALRCITELRR